MQTSLGLLLALCAVFASAQSIPEDADFLATVSWGNVSTEPFDAGISPRDIFARQSCGQGYGRCRESGACCPSNAGCCGQGCINTANTCCASYGGGVCPPGNRCCPNGGCLPPGYNCCGYEGAIFPLDGSECCSNGRHCPPGSRCVRCDYDTSQICCRGRNDDYVAPNYGTSVASLTEPTSRPQPATSTPAEVVTSSSIISTTPPAEIVTSTTTQVTISEVSYSYYTTIYVYVSYDYFPTYTPTTTRTTTTTVTLSAYVTGSADAAESFAVEVSSIRESVSLEASRNTYIASTIASATAGVVGGGGSQESGATSSHPRVADRACLVMAIAAGILTTIL